MALGVTSSQLVELRGQVKDLLQTRKIWEENGEENDGMEP